jgi:protein-disulfide isomerase
MRSIVVTLVMVGSVSGCASSTSDSRTAARGPTIPAASLYQLLQSPARRGPADAPVIFVEVIGICDQCATVDSQLSDVATRFPDHVAIVPVRGSVGESPTERQLLSAFPCANERNTTLRYLRRAAVETTGTVRWLRYADDLAPAQRHTFLRCATSAHPDSAALAESRLVRSWGVKHAPAVFVNGAVVGEPLTPHALDSIVAKALDRP